jgi:hypothetical protein
MLFSLNPIFICPQRKVGNKHDATVYYLDQHGNEIGVVVPEVNAEGRMLRSNWTQPTGLEGTPA